jgi:hypothetical protein
MTGLELVAGYLVVWGVRKLKRAGKRLDEEADEVIDAGLDRLHDAVAAKLGTDPSLVKLDAEVAQGIEPGERTLRRVQDAVVDAAEDDPDFAAVIGELVARLQEAAQSSVSAAAVDLRGAQGVQVGNFNTQTNTFN